MKKNFLMTFSIIVSLTIMTGYTPGERISDDSTENTDKQSTEDNYIDPGFSKLVQVAIVVNDIEAASKRWGELLGMEVPEIRTTRPGSEVNVIYRGNPSDGQIKLTFFVLGQVVIELMEPVGEGTAWKEFLDKNGEGVQHIAFRVENIEKALEKLKANGIRLIDQEPRNGAGGAKIAFIHPKETNGVLVELCERG